MRLRCGEHQRQEFVAVAEHYAVEHENVLNESRTVLAPFWERWLIAPWGLNYHLEHHYFPGIPLYRLPEVQRALVPFYEKKQMRWQSYGRLVYGWLVENHAPHTDWSTSGAQPRRVAPEIHFQ